VVVEQFIHYLPHEINNLDWTLHSLEKWFKGVSFRVTLDDSKTLIREQSVKWCLFDYEFILRCLWPLPMMDNFVLSKKRTSSIHKNHNFYWKILYPLPFFFTKVCLNVKIWMTHSVLIFPRYSSCLNGW